MEMGPSPREDWAWPRIAKPLGLNRSKWNLPLEFTAYGKSTQTKLYRRVKRERKTPMSRKRRENRTKMARNPWKRMKYSIIHSIFPPILHNFHSRTGDERREGKKMMFESSQYEATAGGGGGFVSSQLPDPSPSSAKVTSFVRNRFRFY